MDSELDRSYDNASEESIYKFFKSFFFFNDAGTRKVLDRLR